MPEYVEDLVENFHLISVQTLNIIGPDRFVEEVGRALDAGAEPPLQFMGAGATGSVFCDEHAAYKVAHKTTPFYDRLLSSEYEWLEDAWRAGLPVAEPFEYDEQLVVIVRDCPRVSDDPERFDLVRLHEMIAGVMRDRDWTMPEFKHDSYVVTDDGPIMVDASSPHRLGDRLVRQVKDLLAERRDWHDQKPKDLIGDLEMEQSMGRVTPAQARSLIAKLRALSS